MAQHGQLVGFDAVTETLVDIFAARIIDPTTVARGALAHTASVARLLLATDVMVPEAPEARTLRDEGDAVSA